MLGINSDKFSGVLAAVKEKHLLLTEKSKVYHITTDIGIFVFYLILLIPLLIWMGYDMITLSDEPIEFEDEPEDENHRWIAQCRG